MDITSSTSSQPSDIDRVRDDIDLDWFSESNTENMSDLRNLFLGRPDEEVQALYNQLTPEERKALGNDLASLDEESHDASHLDFRIENLSNVLAQKLTGEQLADLAHSCENYRVVNTIAQSISELPPSKDQVKIDFFQALASKARSSGLLDGPSEVIVQRGLFHGGEVSVSNRYAVAAARILDPMWRKHVAAETTAPGWYDSDHNYLKAIDHKDVTQHLRDFVMAVEVRCVVRTPSLFQELLNKRDYNPFSLGGNGAYKDCLPAPPGYNPD